MPHRYQTDPGREFPRVKLRLFRAVRERFREGYRPSDFRADLMAGIVVAMVAIPLGMALAIASGVPPQHGLYTVIVGGSVVALLGGSRFQVTGPTAAFVVVLAPVAHQFGLGGLLVAGLLAGFLLIFLGMAGMGKLIQFIPYPVTTGFTSGIAVVIAVLQVKDFLGLRIQEMPEHFYEKIAALSGAMHTAGSAEFGIGAATLLILIVWPKWVKRIPAPLAALGFVTVASVLLRKWFPQIEFATVGSRFQGGIPQAAPHLAFPWSFAGADGRPFEFSFKTVEMLMPAAFAITILGGIESLLSAVVADGMAGTKHDPDTELVALGVGNILCPFFGGIAATGAIARTATNIRFGARSPFASVVHALATLAVVLLFAPWVSYLPMAALAALLMLVAYNMAEAKHFAHIVRVAPKSDVLVLSLCFSLTVFFDMVVGVTVGIMLASLLFMRRMASETQSRVFSGTSHPRLKEPLPAEVMLYEIAGPLFFGAAERAAEAVSGITDKIRVVIFNMEDVPVLDITGLVALESAIGKLREKNRTVFLTGVRKQPGKLLRKSALFTQDPYVRICHSLHEAVENSKELLKSLDL